MELGWLLWGAAVLLLLHVLMELSPAVNFALRIGFYYLLFFVCSAFTVPVCLLVNGGRTVKNMRIIKTVVKTFKYFFGLRFEVKGRENFEVEGPAIIVSNHQSILDMMGLMEVLPDDCVQVAKKELMYAGTVGLIIYLGGVIFINRKSTSSAKMVMAEVAKTMATDNVSVTVAWGTWQSCCCLSQQEGSAASGLLERILISPRAGEGVGVPRGHEELHRGLAAVQEGSVSHRCPGTGNSALPLRGDPESFCSGIADWLYSGRVCLLSSELCSSVKPPLGVTSTAQRELRASPFPCRSDTTPWSGWPQAAEKLPCPLS
uniref:1-acylglycerol-3-phosphate O-acyltransferase n=1 Tax=Anser cygnoides TaxID=8845 RepID=A0A8B9ETB2_ANSCY